MKALPDPEQPEPETEAEIFADVYNPTESDLDYFLRRAKHLGIVITGEVRRKLEEETGFPQT